MLHSPKRIVLLKVLKLNKVICFSKRAMQTGTTHSKWRKYALPGKFSYIAIWLLGYLAKICFVITYEIK